MFIADSSVAYEKGKTGLAYNTASLAAYYLRDGQTAPVAISLAAGSVGTWISGGFVEISSANMPGVYELGLPRECIASGSARCFVMLKGATGMADVPIHIDIREHDSSAVYDLLEESAMPRTELVRLQEGVRRLGIVMGTKSYQRG